LNELKRVFDCNDLEDTIWTNALLLVSSQGFDAKTVNELFRGSKPTIGPVQAL
jgi:hypothetical protein